MEAVVRTLPFLYILFMKYNKALECCGCGEIQLSNTKLSFERLARNIGWLWKYDSTGKDYQFCSRECFKLYSEQEKIKLNNINNLNK